MVQVTSTTSGSVTTLTVHFAGSENTEAIKVQKVGTNWQVAEAIPGDYRTQVDITRPEEGIRFSIDGLNLNLTSGGFYLAGNWDGSLYFEHEGPCKIAKGSRLEVTESLFLNKSILFENEGELRIGQDWTCLLTAIQNKGTIVVGQGWQVMALQKFTNEASGNFAMQRADIVSPATEVNNRGNIACVLDWKGEPCTFNNIAGGQVQIGGNCTLKALNNKSEFEPIISEFKQMKQEVFDTENKLVDLSNVGGHPGQWLTKYYLKLGYTSQECRSDCGGQHFIGYKRVTVSEQTITRNCGKKSVFGVMGDLKLMAETHVNACSEIFCGSNLNVVGVFKLQSSAPYRKTKIDEWEKTSSRRWHRREYFTDAFVQKNLINDLIDPIPSTLELLGTSTGKIETFINGKADTTQAVVIKATEAKYEQHKNALEGLAAEKGIPLMLLVDEAEYEKNLQAMKENPVFQTMVRQQELRQARSAAPSGAPSRSLTPEQK